MSETWVRYYPLPLLRNVNGSMSVYGPPAEEITRTLGHVEEEAKRIGARIQSLSPITASIGKTYSMGGSVLMPTIDNPGAATCGFVVVFERSAAPAPPPRL